MLDHETDHDSLTRQDLAESFQQHFGIPGREAERWTTFLLDRVIDSLKAGDSVGLSGFGVFEVVKRKPRVGRNPRTKEAVPIPERTVVTFRPSEKLKLRMNPHLRNSQST
jgi:integration host factor subunit alpha